MATQTQSTNGHDKTYDFAPVEYDAGTLPPRIQAGSYQCTASASCKGNKDNLPMLVVEWTIDAVADDKTDNEQFVGNALSDYIVLSEDPKYRFSKQKLREMLDRLQLSYDLVPRRIENKGDLEELMAAISGQSTTLSVTVRTNEQTGEQRENIGYRAPRGEVAEQAPARTPAKGKAVKGKAARR